MTERQPIQKSTPPEIAASQPGRALPVFPTETSHTLQQAVVSIAHEHRCNGYCAPDSGMNPEPHSNPVENRSGIIIE
jgi:hypothetical protein